MYGFPLIPIYNRAQFVDKTDPCCSTSRRQGRVRTGAAMECHMERHKDSALAPLHWPLLALHMLACAHPGMQRTGDAVTSILPAGIRLGHESASLLRAVEGGPQGNPTPGRRRALSLSAMELYSVQMASEGRYRSYPPIDQRVRHRRRCWPSHAMMLCCR